MKFGETKEHYKMYKKGRTWVFVGMATLTWQATSLIASADTTATTAENSSVVTDQPSVTSKTVTLSSSTAPDSAVATSTTSSMANSATEDTVNSTANVATDTATSNAVNPVADSSTNSTASTTTDTSTSSAASSVTDNSTGSSASTTADKDTSNTVNSVVDNGANSAGNVASSVVDNATNSTGSTANSVAESVINSTVSVISSTADNATGSTTTSTTSSVANNVTSSTSIAAINSVSAAVKPSKKIANTTAKTRAAVVDYAAYHDSTNLDSGIFGTSQWWIDKNNMLHIGAGTLDATNGADYSEDSNMWAFLGVDITRDSDDNTIPWYTDFDGDNSEEGLEEASPITSITLEGKVIADSDSSLLFGALPNLTDIYGLDQLDTSKVTNMVGMFYAALNVNSLDLSHFNTSNVTDMSIMFSGYGLLNSKVSPLDLSSFDTSNVTKMGAMFDTTGLSNLDVSNFNTSKVTNMAIMFEQSLNLTTLNLSTFDTSNVTSMMAMFRDCWALKSINLSSFNTAKTTNFYEMFYYCKSLTTLDLSTFDMGNIAPIQGIEGMAFLLMGTPLHSLTLNPKTILHTDGLAGSAVLATPTIDTTYTGKWMNVTTRQVYTSAELMALYDQNSTVDTTYTYVWQKWINVQDSTLYAGPSTSWQASDNFVDATNAAGNSVGLGADGVTYTIKDATGKVYNQMPVTTPGQYTVTYQFTDSGTTYTSDSIVTIKSSAADIKTTDKVINVGDSWNDWDGLESAVDADGTTAIDKSKITVNSNVDSTKTGVYQVTYSYKDSAGNVITSDPVKVIVAGINVKNTTVVANTNKPWQLGDNFVSGVGTDGKILTVTDVTTDDKVDLTTAGTYHVNYQYQDGQGNTVTATATIVVTVNNSAIDANDSNTLIAGPKTEWQAGDNFTGATDTNGNQLKLEDMTVSGSVDTKKAGVYDVTYQFTDSTGSVIKKTIYVTVKASQAAIGSKNTTVTATTGKTWSAADNIETLKDSQGNVINYNDADIKVSGTVDLSTPDKYTVTYTYTDVNGNILTATAVITVTENKSTIQANDSNTLIAGPNIKWQAGDNFTGATDTNGNQLKLEDMTVSGSVDTKKAGVYDVTYQFTDSTGSVIKKTIYVTVKASQATIISKNTTVTATTGKTWSAADNIATLKDSQGNTISYNAADITVSGSVDFSKPNNYTVTYTYTDTSGNVYTVKATITVTENKSMIQANDSNTLIAGPKTEWQAGDNFTGATDTNGNQLKLEDMTVSNSVDTKKAGVYEVTYQFTDSTGSVIKKTIYVTVKVSQATIVTKDTTVTATTGKTWFAADNIATLKDSQGNIISYNNADITVSGVVDLSTSGKYPVTYSYVDSSGNIYVATATIIVTANKSTIQANDSNTLIAGPKTEWQASDNFTGATDTNGNQLKLEDMTVSGSVDTKKAGVYDVTYQFTDSTGSVIKKTIYVTVKDSQATIIPKNTTVTATTGKAWSAADNIATLKDSQGNVIGYGDADIKVNGTVDLSTPNSYTVTYTYTDVNGNVLTATAVITVTANKSAIQANDSNTLIAGPKTEWQANDNFVGATDTNGKQLTLADMTVKGSVNTKVPGKYEVTYQFTDSTGSTITKTVYITVKASQAVLTVKDTTITATIGKTWSAADNIKTLTDNQGKIINYADADIKVSGTVDLSKTGKYTVTYTYVDDSGNVYTATAVVTVTANKSMIQANDSNTLIAGPKTKWQAGDNFSGATDTNGNQLKLEDMTVSGSVDTKKAGVYDITYQFTDSTGSVITKTIYVTVKASQATLVSKNTTVTATTGSTWSAADNIATLKDSQGNVISYSDADIKVNGTVDLSTPAKYTVTYTYTDANGNVLTATAVITVTANKSTIQANDSNTLIAGPKTNWQASDNFTGATDTNGKQLALADMTVTGSVNTNKAGVYEVIYQFTDSTGSVIKKTIYVTVKASQATIVTKNTTVTATTGKTWSATDNIVTLKDSQGNIISYSNADIKVSGTVDLSQAGKYPVTYTYVDSSGNAYTVTAVITVMVNESTIQANDSNTLIAGPKTKWQASDNFSGATDTNGKQLTLADMTVTGSVNTNKAGVYEVDYQFTDSTGSVIKKTAYITVKASQAVLTTKNTTVTATTGSTWSAADNIATLKDSQGNIINYSGTNIKTLKASRDGAVSYVDVDITVSGTVDLSKAGKYTVTYTYVDESGNVYTATAVVIVTENKSTIQADDSADLIAGPKTNWQAGDNFTGATDTNGKQLTLADMTVTGSVDTKKAGIYEVTYQFIDSTGSVITKKVKVTVKASQAVLTTKDTTVTATADKTWSATDNIATLKDSQGNVINYSDANIKVSGAVDLSKAGKYTVTYTYTDGSGNEIIATAVVTVTANKSTIAAKDSDTLVAGPKTNWQASDNFTGATDTNGKQLTLADMTVKGSVNTKVPGTYEVTYQFTDSTGAVITKTVRVTVKATQAKLTTKNTTVTVADKTWSAADNISIIDSLGKTINYTDADIQVSGTVDLTKAGVYTVTYTYTDASGNVLTAEAMITVTANQSVLTAKDSDTLIAGPKTKWQASDNFTGATDTNGTTVALEDITVTGQVDTTKAGAYQVTYSYTDSTGRLVEQTITVTVKATKAMIQTKNTSVTVDTHKTWSPADNILSILDSTGQSVDYQAADIVVTGTVDLNKAGMYTITYRYTDGQGNLIVQQAVITVTSVATGETPDEGSNQNNGNDQNPDIDDQNNGNDQNYDTNNQNSGNQETNSEADRIENTTSQSKNTATVKSVHSTSNKTQVSLRTANKGAVLVDQAQVKSTDQLKTLPQTGETSTSNVSAAGIMGLILSGTLALFGLARRKRRN